MEPRFNLFGTETGSKIAKRFAGLGQAVHQTSLPATTAELVSLRASQLNGCGFCLDMHVKEAIAAGEDPLRLHLVAGWRETTVFTEAEQAALAFTEEGTVLTREGVSDETWDNVRKHFDDEQVAALVCLLGLINAANRMAVITRQKGGSYQVGALAEHA
ncbi:carboxymuconolactone decarboxylase family protein [Lentzea albidocapillata]|uniref:Alkylhydroperoxidase AhpD family core domain-containing protein n=2 Tax=Lentzea albidocapillata TaxID=40571 RepID=A0A1W2DZE7_9PSEU|nr:carboxymuconolactone decarboxylase family protein [Lentzea albidocapillata]SDM76467.1 alkylhydroperoxidase AhpD family core domain-containing protein [Lentzea albidocapillata subsp. violacea]SMD02874.1 alkylhydroperoxidase AhpD family core domain-containing protein [Lentzea albidocapillata]